MRDMTILSTLVAAAALLLVVVNPLLYRMDMVALGTAIQNFRYGVYLGLGAIALSLLSGGLAFRNKSGRGQALAAFGLVAGFLAFWGPYSQDRTAQQVPPIHDITTDLEDPPVFDAVLPLREGLNSVEYDPAVGAQQREAYPNIQPVVLSASPVEAFTRALATVESFGWEVVAQDPDAGVIEATDTTFWMGFKDDVVIRLRPDGAGTRVDMRSVSRVGRSDIGVNAARIAGYMEELQAGG
jgi:uncharacterized protein (DUF1499 family)